MYHNITHAIYTDNGEEGRRSSAGSSSSETGDSTDSVFSVEEEVRYARRYEEGYDLPDARYDAWLKVNHPDAQKTSPAVPMAQSSSSGDHDSLPAPSTSNLSGSPDSPSVSRTSTSLTVTPPSVDPSERPPFPSISTPVSRSSSQSVRTPLSDLLNLPDIPVKNKDKGGTPKTGRARVLTSTECLRLLLAKEEEKKKVAAEKEKRKQEREAKKKQKEEELKRKADEKVKKIAEREATRAKKVAEKAEKEASKRKAETTGASGSKRPAASSVVGGSRPKRSKIRENIDATINADLCCVCFGSYQEDIGTGREWVQCSCQRWIHEDCVDNDDIEENSGRLCPLC